MNRLLAIVLFALAPCAPAAAQRDLTVQNCFALSYFMVYPFEAPEAWLDGQRYLTFDAGDSGKRPAGWYAVDARSGDAKPFLSVEEVSRGLAAQPGFGKEAANAVAKDEGAYQWNKAHTTALINTANDVFAIDVLTRKVVRVTQTPRDEVGEQFSPDNRLVAYIADYNLHVAPVVGGPERALTKDGHEDLFYGRLDWVYQEELYGRGNFQGYWWSPDSTRIALLRLDESPVKEFTLVSDTPWRPEVEVANYPKTGEPNPGVSIGVVDVRGGDLTWFDLSRYGTQDLLVVRVTWAPDGKEVFFQVQEREQTWLDMLAGDPETGEVRVVFEEKSDCWVEARDEPFWIKGGKEFLWLSERDGFRHVYRYNREGKLLGQLTKGAWEVESIERVDDDGTTFYTTDRDDVRGVQLWRMDLEGDNGKRVTSTDGTHDVKLAPEGDLYVTTFSSAAIPQEIHVGELSAGFVRQVAGSKTELMKGFGVLPPEFVQIPARDGFVMEAMLIKPRGFIANKRYPVLQFTYSGPHAPKVRNRWGGRDFLWHSLMAQKGYVVLVCDNRSASGKGRQAAKACWRGMGTTELSDLEDAVDWSVKQGFADPTRIGIWGWSYGGYQTLFNLTHSKKWKLGIAVNPVTDWRLYDTIYTERYMGLPQTNPVGYQKASVLDAAKDLHGDLLLVHATMDDNVHMQNSLQFVHALQMAGKMFRFMPYPRVRHGIANLNQQMHLFTTMTAFVEEKL